MVLFIINLLMGYLVKGSSWFVVFKLKT